jgi:hypothetical protein
MLKDVLTPGDELSVASIVSAEEAGLRFVSDDEPGIVRVRAGKSFGYRLSSGARADGQCSGSPPRRTIRRAARLTG